MALPLVTEETGTGKLIKTDSTVMNAITRGLISPIRAFSNSKEYISTQEAGMHALGWAGGAILVPILYRKYKEYRDGQARQKALAERTARW